MINISEKTKCCGCTACYSACPCMAIEMKPDYEGFLYPKVMIDKCIQCDVCETVCPIINSSEKPSVERNTYVLRIKDENEILAQSTSGGFITPILEHVLDQNGVVCAAAFRDDFSVQHIIIQNDVGGGTNLSSIRGSKYVQSSLGDCYKTIKGYLEQEKEVCFVGTTCQVEGLKSFLKKPHEKLISVDLVCHGTPSPKLWNKYLKHQKEKYGSEIEEINFRNKTYGYHSGTMKIRFTNGKTYYGSARVDYMLKSFFSEIASRPICYECPFKQLERCSDFTIYDCWHASDLVSSLKDDDRGYTNVIVQSEKGKRLLDALVDRYEVYPTDTERAIQLDGIMVRHSAKPHPRRNEFYQDIDSDSLSEHISKFIPVSIKDRMIERSKHLIYCTGLYGAIKKKIR